MISLLSPNLQAISFERLEFTLSAVIVYLWVRIVRLSHK